MNDFSELERQLRKLRPVQPSKSLLARIERGLAEVQNDGESVVNRKPTWQWLRRFTEAPFGIPIGLGLAAAAVLLIFLRVKVDNQKSAPKSVATTSAGRMAPATTAEFVPADFTRVVYHTSDEGLRFRSGSDQPLRRVRSQVREVFEWRNPRTGATLRVSYPSDEVSLTPISGQ